MNVNDTVSVILTEAGAQHLNYGKVIACHKAGDTLAIPMWELMARFASAFPTHPSMKHPTPFENNTIHLGKTRPQ